MQQCNLRSRRGGKPREILFVGSLGIFFLFLCLLVVPVSSTSCELNSASPHRTSQVVVVDASGTGDFVTIQDAVDFVPDDNTEPVVVCIRAGHYRERVLVPSTKPYITFQGAGRDVTVVEWLDRASDHGPSSQQQGMHRAASLTVLANYFTARNISFKNSAPAPMPGMESTQSATAFRISGDKAYLFGCGFRGGHHTLFDEAGRHYFKDCYIEGSVDFIFGNARSMYKGCQLHSIAKQLGSIAAQGRNSAGERTGFAFVNCNVTGTGKVYVGRATGQQSRIVFAYTYFDDVVAPGGWDDDCDNSSNNDKTAALFGVFRCWGPGAEAVRGVSWARELDYETARPFLVKSFVNGRHWLGPSDP